MSENSWAAAQKFKEQAERCRRLSRQITDPDVIRSLLELAERFDRQAALSEAPAQDATEPDRTA